MNTNDKLIYKIEDVLEKFYHDEQYEMEDGVEAILALISQERERLLKEVDEKAIGKDEQEEYYGGPDDPPMFDNEAITRNKLRAEQRKALSDIGGGNKP